jgi:nucleoside 2-deoxyribosyltransferase
MKIYLAGPINGCNDSECIDWREKFKEAFPQHDFLDPMTRDYRGNELENYKKLVEEDKKEILNCDFFIAYCPFPSFGTAMEIIFAHYNKKPSLIITPKNKPLSPWLKYHATILDYDLDKAIMELKKATTSK